MRPYYAQDGVTIYHGDCLDVMATLGDGAVDVVLTSPPYNLGGAANKGQAGTHARSQWKQPTLASGYGVHDDNLPRAEYVAWQQSVLRACWRLIRPDGAVYYNHKPRLVDGVVQLPLDLNPGLPLRQIVIWDRGSGFNYTPGAYVPSHEWLMLFAPQGFALTGRAASGVGDVWRIPPETRTEHPAPFPLALALRVVETTDAQTYLDPFMGSGTVLRAAKDLGRCAIGIEIDERYCEMAATRLSQGVLDLFGASVS